MRIEHVRSRVTLVPQSFLSLFFCLSNFILQTCTTGTFTGHNITRYPLPNYQPLVRVPINSAKYQIMIALKRMRQLPCCFLRLFFFPH